MVTCKKATLPKKKIINTKIVKLNTGWTNPIKIRPNYKFMQVFYFSKYFFIQNNIDSLLKLFL